MKSYFSERNFLFLYLYKIFYRSSSAIIHIFTGTYMVNMGTPISTVLLFYAVLATTVILTSPFGVASILKFGLKKSAFFSIFCRTSFFLLFLLVEQGQAVYLWPAAIIYGVAYGIFPFKDIMEAVYVKNDQHRGKQITMSMVLSSTVIAVVVAIVGYLLSLYGFIAVVAVSLFMQFCSVWALVQMQGEPLHISGYKVKDGFAFAKSKPMREIYKIIWAQQMVLTTFVIFIPLYIFHIVGDIKSLAYLTAGATILEVILTLLFGKFLDESNDGSTHRKSALMVVLSSLGLIFLAKTPLSLMFIDSCNRISLNSHLAVCGTSIHKISRSQGKKNLLLYSAAWQMIYGVMEVATLLILALVYYYFGTVVFTVMFSISALGGLLNYLNFSKEKEKGRHLKQNGT